jgi:hypothetical protein
VFLRLTVGGLSLWTWKVGRASFQPHRKAFFNFKVSIRPEFFVTSGLVDGHPGHGHRKHQPANLKLACNDPNATPFGPTMALLGTLTSAGGGNPQRWMDAITENPALGTTEMWEIHNFT